MNEAGKGGIGPEQEGQVALDVKHDSIRGDIISLVIVCVLVLCSLGVIYRTMTGVIVSFQLPQFVFSAPWDYWLQPVPKDGPIPIIISDEDGARQTSVPQASTNISANSVFEEDERT